MPKLKNYAAVLLAGVMIGFSGYLHAEIPGGVFPASESPIAVDVIHYDSKVDPYAAYMIPASSFEYRDGKRAVGSALSTFFVGKTVATIGEDNFYAEAVGGLGPRFPDLDKLVLTKLQDDLARNPSLKITMKPNAENGARYVISPRAFLYSDKEGLVSVTFYLETKVVDKEGKRIWWNRYAYKAEGKKPLLGSDGWLGENGDLAAASRSVFGMIVDELQNDLKLSADSVTTEIRFKNCFGGDSKPITLLRENENFFVVKKDLGKIYGPITFFESKSVCQLAEH